MITEDSILQDLNLPQKKGVTTIQGAVLILAGAGSGKTRVITRRIMYLIKKGVPSHRILALTFTKKASTEMKARLQSIGENNCWIGTFHSICLRLLKKHSVELGIPTNFTICTPNHQKDIIRTIYKKEKLPFDKYALYNISQYREFGSPLDKTTKKCYNLYLHKLKQLNLLDFYMLLEKGNQLKILETNWDYVLVDEFQDTNTLQFEIIKKTVKAHSNLCVVGDDDQSIYAWRGAKPEFILNFTDIFPDAQIIKLEQNYRSSYHIIQAANTLIQNNEVRSEKNIFTTEKKGEKIQGIQVFSPQEEAKITIKFIKTYIEQGYSYKDIAILYRINARSWFFEKLLKENNIPFTLKGSLKFYNREEIKDIMVYLKVIYFKTDEDILRIINKPKRTIGLKILNCLDSINIWNSLLNPPPTIKNTQHINSFINLIQVCSKEDTLYSQAQAILKRTNYIGFGKNKTETNLTKKANLDIFCEILKEYEQTQQNSNFNNFLSSIEDKEKPEIKDSVQLMTIHSAKGLEFPIVFLANCSKGVMPYEATQGSVNYEEERRLMYVAITRTQRLMNIFYTTKSPFLDEIALNMRY